MKLYSFILICLFAIPANAQISDKTAFNVAYRYTGRNVLQGGLSYKINNDRKQSFVVGTSLLYTSVESKAKFLPEINFNYTHNLGQAGVSINPYSIEPRLGFSLLNFIYLNTGYAIPVHTEKYFKGFTFGVQFNISPSKNSIFYNRLKLM